MKIAEHRQTLYALAEDQGGYFSTRQATELGIKGYQLYRDVRRGIYEPAGRGVYRLTQFPASRFEDLHVALLRAGPNAVIGFATAMMVYGLSDILPAQTHIILPVKERYRNPKHGIRHHYVSCELVPEEIAYVDGLRVTTPARTIADVVYGGMSIEQVHLAVAQTIERGMTDAAELLGQAKKRGTRTYEIIQNVLTGVV